MQVQPASSPVPQSSTLSEDIIPAVRGEFYSYSTLFSTDRPLGYLMKCRANKDRSLTFGQDNPEGIDLVFLFDHGVRICSPNTQPAIELLGDLVEADELNETRIATIDMTEQTFNDVRARKNGAELVSQVKRRAAERNEGIVTLKPGVIVAVITQSGKYGLLRVREITATSVAIDACHILL